MNIEKQLLGELCNKNIDSIKANRKLSEVCDKQDEFFKTFSEDQINIYRELESLEMDLLTIRIEEAAIYGFRYAVSLINQLNKIDVGEDNDWRK